ncbi:MAG: serine/threonine-protein phosphatase [Planctomycetes bacterium]|nr:serine/threonine-protein phosphatase [Planctomycetota bacterium]
MKLDAAYALGAASHTGRLRSHNEDDFLVLDPHEPELRSRIGSLFVVADGMGGAAGGAEASRCAVRALAGALIADAGTEPPAARLRAAYGAACRSVYERGRVRPALRDMGTTLTCLQVLGGRAVLGHVGDSRCLLHRNGRLRQLTVDHVVSPGEPQLTRVIGAGRDHEEVDVSEFAVEAGDTFVLLSDGVWSLVPEAVLLDLLRRRTPRDAAEALVAEANRRGAPDNATALVVNVRAVAATGEASDPGLSGDEPPLPAVRVANATPLGAPRWPWMVIVPCLLVLAAAAAKAFADVDLVAYLGRLGGAILR